ncbi:carboxylesterase family protein, partial [Streptomyces sp. RKAG290]|nr:carboxylesterase family protein [Streptomyces sp. RKAG290]
MREALTAGDAGAGIPLMAGFTAHEFNGMPQPGLTAADVRSTLAAFGLDEKRTQIFLDTHAPYAHEPARLLGQAVTDTTFRAPTLAVADARARRERPTWLYEFTRPPRRRASPAWRATARTCPSRSTSSTPKASPPPWARTHHNTWPTRCTRP